MAQKTNDDSQRILSSSGKHSVEVNVKISRANSGTISGEQSPQQSRFNFNLPPNNGLATFKRGSWADLLRHQGREPASTIPEILVTPRDRCRLESTGTQTDNEVSTSDGKGNRKSNTSTLIKDYAETINQLHQLCAKLRDELAQVTLAKENMEGNLLQLVRDKDDIIASYKNTLQQQPTDVPKCQHKKNVDDMTEFRHAMSRIRNLINQEVEEMKRRAERPLTPPNPQLEKFLDNLSLSNSDSDSISSGRNTSYKSYKWNGEEDDGNQSSDSSFSSSLPSVIAEIGGGDQGYPLCSTKNESKLNSTLN